VVVMAERKDTPPPKQEAHKRKFWSNMGDRTGLRGKSVWDWLQLLIVPLALAVIGFWFTMQQDARQQQIEGQRVKQAQQIEEQRAASERQLEEQRTQDAVLQAYLDQMSNLLLEKNLLETEVGDPVYTLAQARTTTVMTRLDAEGNRSVTRFLTDMGLTGAAPSARGGWGASGFSSPPATPRSGDASGGEASISLLRGIELGHAELSFADLTDADLGGAFLEKANLSGASMQGANLRLTILGDADLRYANMNRAKLGGATLYGADLSRARLGGGDLHFIQLDHADLSGANLSESSLDGANLSKADLSGATGITNEELELQASSLEGTTMPNGQKYEDWLKSRGEDGENTGS
jgi:uncharacterized protein YjbI with pentapeptide repeats